MNTSRAEGLHEHVKVVAQCTSHRRRGRWRARRRTLIFVLGLFSTARRVFLVAHCTVSVREEMLWLRHDVYKLTQRSAEGACRVGYYSTHKNEVTQRHGYQNIVDKGLEEARCDARFTTGKWPSYRLEISPLLIDRFNPQWNHELQINGRSERKHRKNWVLSITILESCAFLTFKKLLHI